MTSAPPAVGAGGEVGCPSAQLQLYQSIVFATPLLFAALLIVLFCMLCLRRQRQRQRQQQQHQEEVRGRGGEEDLNNLHNATHHSIPARLSLAHLPLYERGLRKSFRQKLPIIPFDEKFARSCKDNQCPVCLDEYQLHEKLQLLPVCKHSFHVECIDEWLAKNTTCPICRTSLLQEDISNDVGIPSEPIENRRWEDRVLNEGQEGVRHNNDVTNGASSSSTNVSASAIAARLSTEHVMNIERS